MKSNICCAMNYEMLFGFRILLLQSVMTIFPFYMIAHSLNIPDDCIMNT